MMQATVTYPTLLSILTSPLSSSVVGIGLKIYLEAKIKASFDLQLTSLKHEHDAELEKLKTELRIQENAALGLIERKSLAYPLLAEFIYRIRNGAREYVTDTGTREELLSELHSQISNLTDLIYKYRIDLEHDGLFTILHKYKNTAGLFDMLTSDSFDSVDDPAVQANQVKKCYEDLDSQYFRALDSLNSRLTAAGLKSK